MKWFFMFYQPEKWYNILKRKAGGGLMLYMTPQLDN